MLGVLRVCGAVGMLAFVLLLSGCQEAKVKLPTPGEKERKLAEYKNRKIAVPKDFPRNPAPVRDRPRATGRGNDAGVDSAVADLERSYQATRTTSFSTGKPEELAVKKIATAINAGLEVGPTLVVWLIDRTSSASKLTTESLPAIKAFYDSPEVRAGASSGAMPLLSALVVYDQTIEFKLDPPASDPSAIKAALETIQPSTSGKEMTFTAVKQALDKYLPLRTGDRREIVLAVITDEAGSDQSEVDAVAELTRKHAVPVYVIGVAAPWGQTNPYPALAAKKTDDDSAPTYGPESRTSGRVQVEMVSAGVYGARDDLTLIESGFGPFALERLCRASGGEFLPIRPSAGSSYYSPYTAGNQFWPTGGEQRFDPKVLSRYTPEYVSAAEHAKLLAASAARRALADAALLPPLRVDSFPETRFVKADDARMTRQINSAQQFAARNLPAVDKFYALLSPGESDRDRLTHVRTQVEFDLAYGRTLAIKTRLDGYNAMLAALKRGKTFQNQSSREWILEPADTIDTGSALQKMAEKAKLLLGRVANEHAGTPWAKLASVELQTPLGWQWREE